jgi:WD40 repeat protein
MALSSDDQYVFTSNHEKNDYIKQFSVETGQMIKAYGPIFENDFVLQITLTPDNKWLFAASIEGHLKQYSLRSQKLIHDYGQIHGERIGCLVTTRDSKWLITSVENHVRRISVKNRKIKKDFGQIHDNRGITNMQITAKGKKLLVGDWSGCLKLISSKDGEVIKDFGQAHSGMITGIVISVDQRYFFTSSLDGKMKQWNCKNNTLFKDHGYLIGDGICNLC